MEREQGSGRRDYSSFLHYQAIREHNIVPFSDLAIKYIPKELPAASTATFDRLRQILRTKLLPLYHASLGLALELTTAILLFLQDNPKVPTHASGNTQTSCEILLVALVSGVLVRLPESLMKATSLTILYRTSSKRTPVVRDPILFDVNYVTYMR